MGDLARRANVVGHPRLKGVALDIADLLLAKSWAEAHCYIMAIRLDHVGCDEVLEFYRGARAVFRFRLWLNAGHAFIQTSDGARQRFRSVGAALTNVTAAQVVVLTDIKADSWPADPCRG